MKAQFSFQDVDNLKRELGHLLPNVKSSHRVEAMARGLGWNTHAALLVELRHGPSERLVNDHVFTGYLKEHQFLDTRLDALGEAVVRCKFARIRDAITAVMDREPVLARWGFGHSGDRTKSLDERRLEFQANRAELLTPQGIDEFLLARDFLSYYPYRRSINDRAYSYGLKHRAEDFHRERGIAHAYVGNGSLIAAALDLGFNYRVEGPNAYFNMGPRQKQPMSHANVYGKYSPPPAPRKTRPTARNLAWRNMMVAAINAGLERCLFGLNEDENLWEGDNAIYQFKVAGVPALAYVADAGFGELVFHVAAQPTRDAAERIKASNAGFSAGEAFALGWLERRKGKWLQTSGTPVCAFRRGILPLLAQANVAASGYLPEGRVML
jgi:hypothetical protein